VERQCEELTEERDQLNKALKQANEIAERGRQDLRLKCEEIQRLGLQVSSLTAAQRQLNEENNKLMKLVGMLIQGVASSLCEDRRTTNRAQRATIRKEKRLIREN
jgi:prefoldin subunit 5